MRHPSRLITLVLGLSLTGVLAATAKADTYKIDPVHSSIVFKIKHANVSYVYGRFNKFEGAFTLDGDKSSVEATAAVESIDTAVPKRDDHLRGPDFFNAKQFPDISFKSTKVEEKDGKLVFTGDLTLHGVTKPVTVELTKVGEGPGFKPGEVRAGLEGAVTIKRSEFGMGGMLNMLGDEVTLMLGFEGVKQ
jgi:polyisoprenoid-binding protein YceI